MITYRHALTCTLALTVLLTVGSGSSFAQKFRGLGGNRSSNSGGMRLQMNGPSGNNSSLNSGSQFKLSGGNNIGKPFQGNFQTQHKTFGGGNSLKGKILNSPTGISQGNLQHGQLGGTLQHKGQGGLLGSHGVQGGKNGSGLLHDLKHGSHGQHGGGLQNVLNGKHNDGHKIQHLGQGNHDGHGHGGKLLHLIQHNQKHGKVCLGHNDWCHAKPKHCHWWYTWCKPLAYCEPEHHHHCQWDYVTCDYLVSGHVVHEDARWFLGLKGMLLPGQGVGIEEVAPGSPAASVGLQPGMVVTRCNGIDMVDEAALAQAIGQSGGVLQMDLLLAEGTPATCVVVMQRVTSVNF